MVWLFAEIPCLQVAFGRLSRMCALLPHGGEVDSLRSVYEIVCLLYLTHVRIQDTSGDEKAASR